MGAWAAGLERVLVLEDDAIPVCDLSAKLRETLEDEACGKLTLEGGEGQDGRGGILLLGATEFNDWTKILEEVAGKPPARPPKLCYAIQRFTAGSFATIYTRSAIPFALRWMEEVPTPFDTMWQDLKKKGTNVNVMYPNLFMPDLLHESATNPMRNFTDDFVEKQIEGCKWEPSLFCNYIVTRVANEFNMTA